MQRRAGIRRWAPVVAAVMAVGLIATFEISSAHRRSEWKNDLQCCRVWQWENKRRRCACAGGFDSVCRKRIDRVAGSGDILCRPPIEFDSKSRWQS